METIIILVSGPTAGDSVYDSTCTGCTRLIVKGFLFYFFLNYGKPKLNNLKYLSIQSYNKLLSI